jgi:polyisoprenoid-binding protein YceI
MTEPRESLDEILARLRRQTDVAPKAEQVVAWHQQLDGSRRMALRSWGPLAGVGALAAIGALLFVLSRSREASVETQVTDGQSTVTASAFSQLKTAAADSKLGQPGAVGERDENERPTSQHTSLPPSPEPESPQRAFKTPEPEAKPVAKPSPAAAAAKVSSQVAVSSLISQFLAHPLLVPGSESCPAWAAVVLYAVAEQAPYRSLPRSAIRVDWLEGLLPDGSALVAAMLDYVAKQGLPPDWVKTAETANRTGASIDVNKLSLFLEDKAAAARQVAVSGKFVGAGSDRRTVVLDTGKSRIEVAGIEDPERLPPGQSVVVRGFGVLEQDTGRPVQLVNAKLFREGPPPASFLAAASRCVNGGQVSGPRLATPSTPVPALPPLAGSNETKSIRVTVQVMGPFTTVVKFKDFALTEDEFVATATVQLATLDAGNARQSEYVLDKVLEVAKYPQATLTIEKSLLTAPTAIEQKANGELSLRALRRPVQVAYSGACVSANCKIHAHFKFNLKEFGIANPNYLGIPIRPELEVSADFAVPQMSTW